ncbi:urease [Entomortierella parvispora]|uniref:Urease n=1 Tax=Entomortierella parvispora TaxID=205924 RepID=A0A9P3H8U6_9FUNG|nr:urease [Entomortierella parvispora]
MKLVPRELDKLVLHQVGFLAQKRLARGLRLNNTEATALIASQLAEFIRDGRHSVADLMDLGKQFLGRRQVLPGVAEVLIEVQIEGTFPDGTKLVTVHDPISNDSGNLELALHGSFLPIPDVDRFFPAITEQEEVAFPHPPGAIVTAPGSLTLNKGRQRLRLEITNTGDRPILVGSHFHLIESNSALKMDRALAYGRRLDIPAGSAIRFEPGEKHTVTIVPIGGKKRISGGNNLATGVVDPERLNEIMPNLIAKSFAHMDQSPSLNAQPYPEYTIPREVYQSFYGPTVGDRVRLGDTNLWIEIEYDYTHYGDECKFGGGKVLREGMGQANGVADEDALDLVITNAIILDYTGIYKADVGIKKGIITGIGKAGNPDVMENVSPNMIVGVTTEVMAGEHQIVVAGGIDTHVHYICPQLIEEALTSGLTTLVGGGTGPNTGSNATTCTPAAEFVKMMMQATDSSPVNIGITGKGNTAHLNGIHDQVKAGVVGLKLHEDWGTTPAAIDNCLTACDLYDVQATIHTDTLNEAGFVQSTVGAIGGRTIHTYHTEGAGGGHAPDIITVCGQSNVLPSSTTPTLPFTKNTLDEHIDMLMVCHHLDKNLPEDVHFAESRIRGETIAAEGCLHDMGAISMISSDAQAMGRIGEVVSRTWMLADRMKQVRGHIEDDRPDAFITTADNFRVKRYVAKYTINPAVAHGFSHLVGSIEVGKIADLVMYSPSNFGTKPQHVLKSGVITYSAMGLANGSIPSTQPIILRPMFGAIGSAAAANSIVFMSQAAVDLNRGQEYGLKKRVEPIRNCRGISKADMKLNDCCPVVKVDPESFEVSVEDVMISDMVKPADTLPLAQSMYIF